MPCICYGATTGKEDYDSFIASEKGKKAMEHITKAASIIMSHKIPIEVVDMSVIEFRQIFVKCFLHMMIGCDEHSKSSANTPS